MPDEIDHQLHPERTNLEILESQRPHRILDGSWCRASQNLKASRLPQIGVHHRLKQPSWCPDQGALGVGAELPVNAPTNREQ